MQSCYFILLSFSYNKLLYYCNNNIPAQTQSITDSVDISAAAVITAAQPYLWLFKVPIMPLIRRHLYAGVRLYMYHSTVRLQELNIAISIRYPVYESTVKVYTSYYRIFITQLICHGAARVLQVTIAITSKHLSITAPPAYMSRRSPSVIEVNIAITSRQLNITAPQHYMQAMLILLGNRQLIRLSIGKG